MRRLVVIREERVKREAAQEQELKEKMERREKMNFRLQFEEERSSVLARLSDERSRQDIEEQRRKHEIIKKREEARLEKE